MKVKEITIHCLSIKDEYQKASLWYKMEMGMAYAQNKKEFDKTCNYQFSNEITVSSLKGALSGIEA